MFQDENLECQISIPSSWRKDKYIRENETQTKKSSTTNVKDKGSQSVSVQDGECQTEFDSRKQLERVREDRVELAEFLKRVESLMEDELYRGFTTHAFVDFQVRWEDSSETVKLRKSYQNEIIIKNQLQTTCLDWNNAGTAFYAGFGRSDHEDWCTHSGQLVAWSVLSDRSTSGDWTFELESCVTSVRCHPKLAGVVAVGLFSGLVLVLDRNRPPHFRTHASPSGDERAHREPVSALRWLSDDVMATKFKLMSSSSDGQLILWRLSGKSEVLKISSRFTLTSGARPVGITCFDVSSQDDGLLVCGAENGKCYRCSLDRHSNDAVSVQMTFDAHAGPVTSVDVSPRHGNLFLSTSSDQACGLHNLLQAGAVLAVDPAEGYLFHGAWSSARSSLLALAAQSGRLLLFDLAERAGSPSFAGTADGAEQGPALLCVSFNRRDASLLLAGSADGRVHLWNLSAALQQETTASRQLLDSLAHSLALE